MFTMRLAGLNILVKSENPFIENRCKDYVVPDVLPDLTVSTLQKYLDEWHQERSNIPEHFYETGAIFYTLYERLLEYDAFSLHSVLVQVDGEGYAFSAAPGTGKSTHASRWLELLGERASIVDGDHPIVRILDGTVYAYGTPFCGKERFNENRRVPLKGICFLRRAEMTSVVPMDPREAVLRFGWNDPCFNVEDETLTERQLELYERIAELVPAYWLDMNNFRPDAAKICFETIAGRRI